MATYLFYIKDGKSLIPITPTISRAHVVMDKASEGLEIGTPVFTVGSHRVKVFLNGLFIPETTGFTENADGSGIKVLYNLEAGDELDIEVMSSAYTTN